MKKSTERWMCAVAFTVLGLNVVGVTAILVSNAVHKHRYHRDLLSSKAMRLKFAGPENVQLQEPHANAREDGLVVSGCVNRIPPQTARVAEEVDLSVLSPEGTLLERKEIHELSPCKLGGIHFSVKLASIPPYGSVLDIVALAHGRGDDTKRTESATSPRD